MKWINRCIAVALLASVPPLWQQADEFPGGTAIFPKVLLAALCLLAAIMLATSFIARYTDAIEAREGAGSAKLMLRPAIVFALALGGVSAISLVGFFPAMIAVAAAAYVPLGVARPATYALSVTLLLAAVYLIFVTMLGVPLPAGSLWQG